MPNGQSRKTEMRSNLFQMMRFGIAGIINTIVGYAIFWIANQMIGIQINIANAISYAGAICIAYLLNKFFVFFDRSGGRHSGLMFLLSFALAFCLNQAVIVMLVWLTDWHPGIIQLFGMASYSISFFLLNKYIVFSSIRPSD